MREPAVSSLLGALGESQTLAVDARVQELTAEGHDIVNLSAGQPDFPTPEFICQAAARAIVDGATRYTPPGGTRELRAAAAGYLRDISGIPATEAGTMITSGAKYALYDAMITLLEPGDEVMIPEPYWVSYPEQVRLVGAVPVAVHAAAGLRIAPGDLDRALTPKTRALILNSPNNPTGQVYPPREVEAITGWCLEKGITIISDEIYNQLVFDGLTAVSPASLGPDAAAITLTVNGVSKSHAMTGWRIGTLSGPEPLIKAACKFQGQTTGNPSSVSQAAALAALTGPREGIETMRRAYEARRDLAVRELGDMPGVEIDVPQGAFYAFPRVADAARHAGGSVALAASLVENGVAAVPGAPFGSDDHIRISFALGDDRLAEGLRRLRSGLTAVTA